MPNGFRQRCPTIRSKPLQTEESTSNALSSVSESFVSESSVSESVLERLRSLHPRKIDLSLARCARLLRALDEPQERLPPVIHIAGTNGKGSTLACFEASLLAAGLSVQAYTSPHLCRFNERIRFDAQPIADALLATCLERAERANAEQSITFFEITTAAAFLAFAAEQADFLVLETGLGGRLDATNLVQTTRAAVLTPVDLDHAYFLGNDIRAITREKVAIAKPNSLLVSAAQACSDLVLARTRELDIPCLLQGRDFATGSEQDALTLRFHACSPLLAGQEFSFPPPCALGRHQRDNAALAAATLLALHEKGDISCSREALLRGLARGIATFSQPARLQQLSLPEFERSSLDKKWEVRLDGAHNPHAARAVARALHEHWHGEPYCMILAMMGGKDVRAFVEPFVGKVARGLACESVDNETGSFLTAQELAVRASEGGLSLTPALSKLAACAMLAEDPTLPRRLLITGSLYFAGEWLAEES